MDITSSSGEQSPHVSGLSYASMGAPNQQPLPGMQSPTTTTHPATTTPQLIATASTASTVNLPSLLPHGQVSSQNALKNISVPGQHNAFCPTNNFGMQHNNIGQTMMPMAPTHVNTTIPVSDNNQPLYDVTQMLAKQISDLSLQMGQLAESQNQLVAHLNQTGSLPGGQTNATPPAMPAMPPAGNFSHLQNTSIQHPWPQSTPTSIPGLRNDVHAVSNYQAISTVEGVPDATIKAALSGEFIYLDQFLLNVIVSQDGAGELHQFVDTEGHVSYKPKRAKRKITNLQSWLEAWANYEKLMIKFHGIQLYDTMWDYRKFICECERKFNWSAVALYDIRHRAKLSRKSVEFAKVDSDLQAQILDSTAIKVGAPRCFRCSDFSHTAGECPFPTGAARKATPPKAKKVDSNAICRNYNSLRCVLTSCPRRHICKSCQGDLPYDLCVKSGPCSAPPT